jgi:hypothetical protein
MFSVTIDGRYPGLPPAVHYLKEAGGPNSEADTFDMALLRDHAYLDEEGLHRVTLGLLSHSQDSAWSRACAFTRGPTA